jgi:SpoIIAA-like
MPVTYAIDVPRALIVTRCFGRVTLAEVQQHFQELARVWPPVDRLNVLLDLTEQTSLPALRDLEEAAAELDEQIGPRRFGRCAVVTEQPLHVSMQMFEVLVGRLFDAIEIFRTPSAAVVWLVPTPPRASRPLTTQ